MNEPALATANALTAPALHRPPSADGLGLGGALSLAVHLGLVAALAVSVSWRRHSVQPVSAELWAAVPQVAAPAANAGAPTPPPPPPPTPKPAPPPPRPAPATPPPAPTPAALAEADIAVERARQKKERELREQAQREQERREAQQRELAQKAADDKKAAEKKAADKLANEKRAADKRAAEQQAAEREAAQQARADKAQAERVARLREEALQRLQNQLGGPAAAPGPATGSNSGNSGPGGTGAPGSAGTAARSAGPSAGYEGRIRARILPNIVYTGRLSRSIVAEVEIRLAPDGSIVGKRLTRSSGTPDWDEAVLKAIEKTEMLPRDLDGRIPPVMTISLDPGSR